MSETILAVLVGGILGIFSTVITLLAQARTEQHKQREASMRDQIGKLSKSVEILLDVEDALLDRLRIHESIAKRTLKKDIRDSVGGEGISNFVINKSTLMRIINSVPVSKKEKVES
jgi:hypothetical protein